MGDELSISPKQTTQEESPVYIRKAGSRNAAITEPEPLEVLQPPAPAPASTPEPTEPTEPIERAPTPWVPDEPTSGITTGEFDLPEVQPAADLPRLPMKARWVLLVFGITLLVYLAFANRFILYSSPPTGDQAFYMMVTMSIVQDGDINVANNYANHDEDKFYSLAPHPEDFVGIAAPYPLPPHNAYTPARPPTEQYNFHLPGLSLEIAPAWLLGGLFGLWWPATIIFMCMVGALLTTNIFLLAREITGHTWIAVAVWAALAFSNPIMTYSYLIFSELSTAVCLLYAFRRLAMGWGANGPVRLLLTGLCIAFIPWLAWRCILITVMLGLYAAVQWWRYYRANRVAVAVPVDSPKVDGDTNAAQPAPNRQSFSRIALQSLWVVVPIALSGVLLIWYNTFLFGSIMPNSITSERGDLPLFYWPWQGQAELSHFFASGYGMLFDRVFGLLAFAPIYFLAVIGMIAMFQSRRRSDRRLLLAMAVIMLPYIAMLMSYFYWNGLWCPPARFLTTLAPLLAAPLAMSLFACKSWIYRIIYGLMCVPGFFMMAAMLLDPRRIWPGNVPYQELSYGMTLWKDAPFSIKVDVWNLLPAIDPLDERSLPSRTAWVTIAALIIVALGYLLMTRWRQAQGTRRLPFVGQGATWAAALAVVGISWYFTNYDYIQHKTILTEVRRIGATKHIEMPRGIEYLDDKVYVTDYVGKTVGVFDLTDSTYSQLEIKAAGQVIPYEHPGDIKRGPNNDLYLLNNGGGENDLYDIKPDGTLIRKLSLIGKTPTAAGLYFGPNGDIFVADVTGGGILEYGPDGGTPLNRYTGKESGFNNVIGVAVAADGKVYAAESSMKLVHEMEPGGQFIRAFAIGCSPFYMATKDNWLDVSCPDKGIVSVNLKTGEQQRSDYKEASTIALQGPTGLAYGSNGKLYVIDGDTLVEYEVEH